MHINIRNFFYIHSRTVSSSVLYLNLRIRSWNFELKNFLDFFKDQTGFLSTLQELNTGIRGIFRKFAVNSVIIFLKFCFKKFLTTIRTCEIRGGGDVLRGYIFSEYLWYIIWLLNHKEKKITSLILKTLISASRWFMLLFLSFFNIKTRRGAILWVIIFKFTKTAYCFFQYI